MTDTTEPHAPQGKNVKGLFASGHVIDGCYEIRQILGKGGMGQVFEAHDRELNRRVAIKVTPPGLFEDELLREARVMAAFHHPGLPIVHATGKHDGVRYVVMERLSGRSLGAYMRPGTVFGAGETRDILLAVAESLSILHDANLAHRDIKPDNIMVVPPQRIVLVDFGITNMEQYMAESDIAGSMHYIAPEVLTNEVRSGFGHLTDIYALGVIGFQMLTGRTPYLDTKTSALICRVVSEDAPSITRLRPGVYAPLADLLSEMLTRVAAERPPSIDVVVAQLRAMQIADSDRPRALGPEIHHTTDTAHIATPTRTRTVTDEGADHDPIRILVADDEQAVWELLSYVLEDYGYDIVFVSDGQRAVEEFEKGSFEIVITDKNMPKMSGIELLRHVKRLRPSTDVVLITGYPSRRAEVESVQGGAVSLIEKPFDIDEIAQLGAKLAKRQRELRTNAAAI